MERRTPTITITGTVITIIITGTTDITGITVTGITVTGTIDIGDIITGVIGNTDGYKRAPPMSAAWSVQVLAACFIVTDSAGRAPHRYRPPLVADVAYWPFQQNEWVVIICPLQIRPRSCGV